MNKEIEMLYKTLEAKDKIINEQVLEIARLNSIIDKAIELIKKDYKRIKDMAKDLPVKVNTDMPIYDKLLKILGDKENE